MTTRDPPEDGPIGELTILGTPSGPRRGARGGVVLTKKYVDGVLEYCKNWPGNVAVLVALNDLPSTDMDRVEVFPGEHGFLLEERPATVAALKERLAKSGVVLEFLSRDSTFMAGLCAEVGVPLVYISEYSRKTDLQIIDAEVTNPLRRCVRKARTWLAHRAQAKAVSVAAGVQCSGTPTHDLYKTLNADALLFVDNRVRCADVVSNLELQSRAARLLEGGPLRLVFGGRLLAMKGVMDLPLVALHLTRLGVPFTLDIFGSGPLEGRLRSDVTRLGLGDRVRLRGVAQFASEWIPMLKRDVDVFVCCHTQGDPSSTYSEVMACGVPIAGYANEAFEGIVRMSQAGWPSVLAQPKLLAEVIARLSVNRHEIVDASEHAAAFAAAHAFEKTFAQRTSHLLKLARRSRGGA